MIKAMLAHKFDESRVDWNELVFIQAKLDGVRCLFTKHGAFSRTGKKFMNIDHIERDLKEFFDENPDIVLDGELYNHELKHDFEKIISLVRKQKPTVEDRINASRMIQYHVYDYVDGKDEVLSVRDSMRYQMIGRLEDESSSIKLVRSYFVESMKQAKTYHKHFLEKGYEGSILRLNRPYEQKRSFGLMKFKDFSDKEATIIDYVPGKGKRQGTIGKFVMIDSEGVKFGCPPGKGFKHKHLAWMLANVDLFIGKTATFTYFQRTKAGSYRHPQFKAIRDYE